VSRLTVSREHVRESVNTALRGCTLKERWHGDVSGGGLTSRNWNSSMVMDPVKGKAATEASWLSSNQAMETYSRIHYNCKNNINNITMRKNVPSLSNALIIK